MRYSQGFNPRPHLWLPLPRTAGVASDDELLIVELEGPQSPEGVLQRLAGRLPDGLTFVEAFALAGRIVPRPVEATYHLDLSEEMKPGLSEASRRLLSAERLEVSRSSQKVVQPRRVDLRSRISRVELIGNALVFALPITPEGSARPAEVLELLGLSPVEVLHRLRRVSIRWDELVVEPAVSADPA